MVAPLFFYLFFVLLVATRSAGVAPRKAVDPALDCGLRAVAYNFSQFLNPSYDVTSLVFDALRLGIDCGMALPHVGAAVQQQMEVPIIPSSSSTPQYYISPSGSDAGDGSVGSPFATLARGLEASRSGASPATLYLRGGTYFQSTAITLSSADSGLSIVAFPGELPTLSGGEALEGLSWSVYRKLPGSGGMTGPFPGLSTISDTPGLTPGGNATGIVYAGSFPTAAACENACNSTPICSSYTWHDATVVDGWALECFFRTDGVYAPTSPWPGHYAGEKTAPGVAATIYSTPLASLPFLNLYDGSRNRRFTRAKTPNGNPEETINGFTAGATKWLPPHAYDAPQEIHIASPSRADDPFFPTYQYGVGGTCAIFSPAEGFWCTKRPPAGAQFNVPSGVQLPQGLLSGNWSNASGGVFHAFHGARWGDWKFLVDAGDSESALLTWTYGGFQEARGWATGDTFMLENLLELLDEHDEFFVENGLLYLALNDTATTTGNEGQVFPPLIATRLDSLLRLEGTSDAPVVNVSLRGLTFSHTAPTFMKPYAMTSGGDWSTRIDGALFLEGTAGTIVDNCTFSNLGGNAVFIYGFNRGASISNSRFRYIGDSAIVSLGRVQGINGIAQDTPWNTRVISNVMSELGLYTKQSGVYYHALSGNATVVGNIFFNIPRAGININDGYAGGHNISNNLGFNCVRETSDHGCFNSWDRQPYIWNPSALTDLYPAQSTISRNIFLNNFHSTWPIDHDDGSNNYLDTYNLLVWGGGKNYLGFHKTFIGNFYIYPDANEPTLTNPPPLHTGFSPYCYGSQGGATLPPQYRDAWVGETCIVSGAAGAIYSIDCDPSSVSDGQAPTLLNNSFFTADATYKLSCGSEKWDLPTAQAHGLDVGSTIAQTPSTPEIISMASAFVQRFLMG